MSGVRCGGCILPTLGIWPPLHTAPIGWLAAQPPIRCQVLHPLVSTALTPGPTVIVAGPVTLLLSIMSLVFVDERSA